MWLLSRCISVSRPRKLTEVLDFLIVNLIVLCTLSKCVVNFSSLSLSEAEDIIDITIPG